MASYNGRFFDGGYNGNYKKRDYIKESISNIEKQIPLIKDISFQMASFELLAIPPKSIIYCDPPYNGAKQYRNTIYFNYALFWQWCREMTMQGHSVYISEYNAPKDFECIWQKKVNTAINNAGTKKGIEKLFILKK